ncbi:MAG: response regulator [Proteobacteria bacterium]|nr:response regulator [Pseudomonadota bacterium]
MQNAKIAVVGDDKIVRDYVINMLMYCVNREILSFEDGFAAWNYLENPDSPDVIFFSDVNMPGMNGLELLTKIKEKHPHKICIMISGDPTNEKLAMELGADAFLAKPFTTNDLFSIVETLIIND